MGKLNNLIKTWPNGTVAVQSWLEEQGIYRQLSNKYVANGWAEKIGHGAMIQAGDSVNWLGGMYALQQGAHLLLHVGGKTALELLDKTHFIPVNSNQNIYLYNHGAISNGHLSKWFTSYFNTNSFDYVTLRIFNDDTGLQDFNCGNFTIKIASAERAIMEILAVVPRKISFQHAYLLMQNQDTLRVAFLQALLEKCKIHTVKRLFLYLAKKCDLPLFERLDLSTVELGVGRRKIGGSTYIREFNIVVPNLDDCVIRN